MQSIGKGRRLDTPIGARERRVLTDWTPPLADFPQHVATVSREGGVLYLNRRGGPFGDAQVGTLLEDGDGHELWAAVASGVEAAFANSKRTVIEVRVEAAWYTCTIFPFIDDDVVEAAVIVAQNVTSFRQIIDQMPDCVMLHRAGQILYANKAWADLLGYASSEFLVGRDMFEFIHPDERDHVMERMVAMAATGDPAPAIELRLLDKDGVTTTVELAPVQIVRVAGGPASLVVARDIAPRRRMHERFLLSDRVASMGRLAAGVAHEINNPLTYVIGNLSVAAKGLSRLMPLEGENDAVHDLGKAIADARSGAERVRHIVGDLRAFSRPDRGDLTNLDLRKVLDAAINMAWSQIRHGAVLLREYRETPTVRGSETRLGQVFLNLLVNATQAIEAGDADKNTIRVVTTTDEAGRARVDIYDTGIGFTTEVADRMWDPFFTTKAGEGTGLGLSICQSIVTSHGGEISARSSTRHGTVFTVSLPPVDEAPDVAVRLPTATPESEPIVGRVLVVDDEPIVATLVRRALEPHDVYIMTSGRDALELCTELDFDVIVCDVLMPDLNGMDLYQRLRDIRPGLEKRVVFMTAGAYTKREGTFLSTVDNPIVEKPFDLDVLSNTVQAVLRRSVRSGAPGASAVALGVDVGEDYET